MFVAVVFHAFVRVVCDVLCSAACLCCVRLCAPRLFNVCVAIVIVCVMLYGVCF